MKLNNKGMTMVEIMASVVLISIVLIFLMNLFVNVRSTYNQSKVQSDYEILVSNVINAIGKDIDEYGLKDVRYERVDDYSTVILVFNSFRPTDLSDNITKVLKLYSKDEDYYLSYSYDSNYTKNKNITAQERVTNVVRVLPSDVVLGDNEKYIDLSYQKLSEDSCARIKVFLSNAKGSVYDINVYGICSDCKVDSTS